MWKQNDFIFISCLSATRGRQGESKREEERRESGAGRRVKEAPGGVGSRGGGEGGEEEGGRKSRGTSRIVGGYGKGRRSRNGQPVASGRIHNMHSNCTLRQQDDQTQRKRTNETRHGKQHTDVGKRKKRRNEKRNTRDEKFENCRWSARIFVVSLT